MTRRIDIDGRNVVLIEGTDPDKCELCGIIEECRPYGKKLESGRRLNVCYDCGMKDEASTAAAFKEMFE